MGKNVTYEYKKMKQIKIYWVEYKKFSKSLMSI